MCSCGYRMGSSAWSKGDEIVGMIRVLVEVESVKGLEVDERKKVVDC